MTPAAALLAGRVRRGGGRRGGALCGPGVRAAVARHQHRGPHAGCCHQVPGRRGGAAGDRLSGVRLTNSITASPSPEVTIACTMAATFAPLQLGVLSTCLGPGETLARSLTQARECLIALLSHLSRLKSLPKSRCTPVSALTVKSVLRQVEGSSGRPGMGSVAAVCAVAPAAGALAAPPEAAAAAAGGPAAAARLPPALPHCVSGVQTQAATIAVFDPVEAEMLHAGHADC